MKSVETNPELYELSRHVPKRLIKPPAPGKYGDYVPHYVIVQILLATVGPYDWTLVEVLRGDSSGTVKEKRIEAKNVVVGAVYRLGVEVDGRPVVIEEVGSVDAYKESNDGERLKKASSDALKRAAMRLGVAIHLWAKTEKEWFLAESLRKAAEAEEEVPLEPTEDDEVVVGAEEQDETEPDRSGSKAPESIAEAEKNLRDAGLLEAQGGEITLPTGRTVEEPTDLEGWTKLAKKETFLAVDQDETRAKALYENLVRSIVNLDDSTLEPTEVLLEKEEALEVIKGLA